MDWIRDLRVGLRGLLRRPGFAVIAVSTLAVAIGANTAIYGLVQAVVRALPFPHPDRLVQIWETAERETLELRSPSFPILQDLERDESVFEEVAGIHRTAINLADDDGGEPERVIAEMVSPSYFRLVDLRPIYGSLFTSADDRLDLMHAPVVISRTLWQRRYGEDPGVIGRRVLLNEVSATVVAVVDGNGVAGSASLWLPLQGALLFDNGITARRFEQRGVRWLDAIARLRAGVSLDEAHAFMRRETARLRDDYPDVMDRRGVSVMALEEGLLGDVRRTASALMIAVVLVLLVACANLAGLVLARGVGRNKEIALRLAMGASRGRVARQLLSESLLLSLAGGLVGLALAWLIQSALAGAAMFASLPSYVSLRLDAGTFGFATVATLLTALLFGVVPAVSMARSGLVEAMRGRAVSRQTRGRGVLVAAQVGLALALAVASVLVLRSLARELRIDPGFVSDGVYTLRVELPAGRYDGGAVTGFAHELEMRLEAIAGVRRAALATDVPLVDGYSAFILRVEDRVKQDPDDRLRVYHHEVTPGFFSTLGIRLLQGRAIGWQDTVEAPLVAVVTRRMASASWPGEEPIGKRVSTRGPDGPWRTVVGVVEDVRYRNLVYDPVENPEDPDIYFPLAQAPRRELGIVVGLDGPAESALAAVRRELGLMDPALPIFGVRALSDVVSDQLALSRFAASLLLLFGVAAVGLSALGVYGLLSQLVAEKTFEIGIRIAVGAGRKDVLLHVMGWGLRLVAMGVGLGLGGSLLFGRFVESLLFEISVIDPLAYCLGSAVLLSLASAAVYLPARRASRFDPVQLLAGRS